MARQTLNLKALLDFEAQMARDSLLDDDVLRDRDQALRPVSTDKSSAVAEWLSSLQQKTLGEWPGAALLRIRDTASFAAIVLGLISGVGLVRGLLLYDGSQPVNVIPFLAIFALLQFALILNYIFKAAVYRLFKRFPGGALFALLRKGTLRLLDKRKSILFQPSENPALPRIYLRRLAELHPKLLQNLGWSLFQSFGMACHLAALATFLGSMLFNDYTFGWRTTLSVDPEWMHRALQILLWPFQALGEFANPSLELVRSSQFSRYENRFLYPALADSGARATAAWWPLIACVIAFYAFLPRLVFALMLKHSIRKECATFAFDDFQSLRLLRRLMATEVAWETDKPLAKATPIPEQSLVMLSRGKAPLQDCLLIKWRDLPIDDSALRAFFAQNYSLTVRTIQEGQGLGSETTPILDYFRSHPDDALVIAADPWELPGESIDRLRKALRMEVGRKTLILFAPLERGADIQVAGDRRAWQHALKLYRDSFLGLLEPRTLS